ncbi:hypothetical protein [Microbacterium sp. NPDC058389]|uniref:hypothetical protein n=1 Tax=Microbacterium sp. NPDC058389 TaxID=3346475 RepID=UPI003665DC1D
MPITHSDVGADEQLARRILIRARGIAPCIAGLDVESEEGKDALAILKGVYARAADVGTGAVSSRSRNGTSISLRDIKSAFAVEDIAGLRSLCGDVSVELPAAHARGSFPTDRPVSRLWPEGEYT